MPAHAGDVPCAPAGDNNNKQHKLGGYCLTEEVVISGISGRLPESDNIWEFREHLRNGEDMVTADDRRWPQGMWGLPTRNGKLKDLSKFDATFFGVHAKQAHQMDPQLRMLLELTYEAIVDAGINPQSLRGSNTGVFVGCSSSESDEALNTDPESVSGYVLTGCQRSMFPNRVSFTFDFKGPSFAVDTACSSSLIAMDQALTHLRTGQCDYAVVAGVNLCLKPANSLQFHRLGMLSTEGKCKAFDETGAGYVRSEAAAVVFLQRASSAKRNYATVVHCKANTDGNKQEGVTYPSGKMQGKLLQQVYAEAKVNPSEVVYVEAHGTGTKVGDPQEINAITEVFCGKDRKQPLMIGSVKSNMGHSEPASGVCSIVKVLIAMEDGVIPANLHFKTPNPDIPGLLDGRLKVISEPTPWDGGLVGINSFGFGGANVHLILRSNPKPKSSPLIEGPKLFAFSGRTEEAVDAVLANMEKTSDQDLYGLLTEVMENPQPGHPYRGYTILNSENNIRDIQKSPSERPPIWYVFSGMGTQWIGMGQDLLEVEVFRKSIMHLDGILKPYGVYLLDILENPTEESDKNILNNFVTIAAIQIALVDTLKFLGVKPDGMVGHSVGELGCAYADDCFTAEQMILAAYWRGKCVQEAKLPVGAMAAVGLTWEEAKKRCPKDVVPACHNAEDTVTISGEASAVRAFVEQLKKEEVFAKEVKSSNIAFHCYYMAKIAPQLQASLERVIPTPKSRTSRWISSSIPEENWGIPLAKTSSAAYHVNNLVSPVLFQEALRHVPRNAVVIEIAPHCLLQAILKRSIGSEASFLALMKRGHSNNLEFFLTNIGKLYNSGWNLNISKLYHPTSFPVPRGTSMISPMIGWDHEQSWTVATVDNFISGGGKGTVTEIEVDVSSAESKDFYLVGHQIDGRVLFPATGYLVTAWKVFAQLKGDIYERLAVQFEDVALHRATILPKNGKVKFHVSIMEVGGEFEISEGGTVAVSGRIKVADPEEHTFTEPETPHQATSSTKLKPSDIYKELRLRGYEYGPTFQGVAESDLEGSFGKLRWNGNWVSFMDTMLQFSILGKKTRQLCLPTRFQYLKIDPVAHLAAAEHADEFPVEMDSLLNVCLAGGVKMMGLKASIAPRRQGQQASPLLEEYHFVPYEDERCYSAIPELEETLRNYSMNCLKTMKTQAAKLLKSPQSGIATNFISALKSIANLKLASEAEVTHGPSNGLKQVLDEIFSQSLDANFQKDAATKVFGLRSDIADPDDLFHSYLHPHFIKPYLDVVRENCSLRKLKVLEVEAKGTRTAKIVVNFLNSHPMMTTDYTVSTMTEQDLETEDEEFTKVVWDIEAAPAPVDTVHLVIGNGVLTRHQGNSAIQCLRNVFESLKQGGFAFLVEPRAQNPVSSFLAALEGFSCIDDKAARKVIEDAGFTLIGTRSDNFLYTGYLIRKVAPVVKPVPFIIEDTKFGWVEELKKKMAETDSLPEGENRLWLSSNGQPTSGIVGLVNCLRQEARGDKIRSVFDSSFGEKGKADVASVYKKDLMSNVYRNKQWGFFCHLPIAHGKEGAAKTSTHAFVNVLTRGDLSSLRWFESPLKNSASISADTKLCYVYYAPLNFRDIMLATGKLPPDALPGDLAGQECILGLEFAGRDETGRRVMGLVAAKGLATSVAIDPQFMWTVPDSWTLEDAATVPVVYATAYYALILRGGMKSGESVLIHSGSGGVGQAAISIALSMGCTVYTTVGSTEKKEYLKKRFPQLKDQNFANSRDTSFEFDVLRQTGGKGVDLVLNSLAEEKLQASVRCLAYHGRFLEIGKFDLSNNTPLGMSIFLKNISFHGILLDALFEKDNPSKAKVVQMLNEGIASGAVQPLSRTVFERDQLEQAFRFMATGKHIGKVLLKIRDEELKKVAQPSPVHIPALPRTICHPQKTYIVTGGLGGFGLELAHWLVDHGAKHLVLSSRSGVTNGYQARCMKTWKEQEVDVRVSSNNVGTIEGTTKLLTEAQAQASVGGIFNLAMVLRDDYIEDQTEEKFKQVAEAKVFGTHNLDVASRKLCPNLEWFVVFSSVSCGRGNIGQSNYGFANSTMERICEQRRKDRLHGLAIQWGAIGDVGVVQETMGGNDVVIGGTLPQRIGSCLWTLERMLGQEHAVVASTVLAEMEGPKTSGGTKASLVDVVANILGVKDSSSLSASSSLAELGMDSLMGVEIKQTLERDFDLVMSAQEIRQLTVGKLRGIGGGDAPSKSKDEKDQESKDNWFDSKELVPKNCIVKMNESQSGLPLFIIHPVEGNTTMLKTLATKLKNPVYGVQYDINAPSTSVQKLAAYYIKNIEAVQKEPPYQIAGYSLGSTLAFEVALQMQKKYNKEAIRSLTFLDGSHCYVSAMIEGYKDRAQTEGHKESDGLLFFALQFADLNGQQKGTMPDGVAQFVSTLFHTESTDTQAPNVKIGPGFEVLDWSKFTIKSHLVSLPSWSHRLAYVVDLLMDTGLFKDRKEVEWAAEQCYKRLIICGYYEPESKFNGPVTLVRAKDNTSMFESIGDKYALDQVCAGDIRVEVVPGNHKSFLMEPIVTEVAEIVNTVFDVVGKR